MYTSFLKTLLYDLRKKIEKGILYGEEINLTLIQELANLIDSIIKNDLLKEFLLSQTENIKEIYNFLLRLNFILSEAIINLSSNKANIFIQNLIDLIDYRIHWDEFPIDYKPNGLNNPKILSAREAVSKIPDSSVVYTSGFAANGRCSIFFRALREVFKEKRSPKNLTWISVSAQGGRGKAPGTIEELAIPVLIKEYICGHLETAKKFLELAQEGKWELHTMPQGEMAFLIEAQKNAQYSLLSDTGLGTFLDPRVGAGSAVINATKNYISVKDNLLEYSLPKIDVALLSAPFADEKGNIYLDKSAVITEMFDASYAAKKNEGLVIVAVSDIISEAKEGQILPHELVDYIVVNPKNEQVGGVKQRKYWKMFLPKKIQEKEGTIEDIDFAISQIKIINSILGITPYRKEIDNLIARLATYVFVENVKKNSIVNIGIGLPEEVSRILYETGIYKDLIFTTESGVYGGLPVSGIFFGASINPEQINQSSWMFHLYEKNLDVTVLGMLEVDSLGNVNVSSKGSSIKEYVGPGGFPNITKNAKTIIFVGPFMWKSKIIITDKGLKIQKSGKAKFVKKLHQITFNAQHAIQKKKKVFYVTDVGIFELQERGLVLTKILPGISTKEIQQYSEAQFIVSENLEVLDLSFVTGENFPFSELKEKKESTKTKNKQVISLVS